jgi:hypothetical protein
MVPFPPISCRGPTWRNCSPREDATPSPGVSCSLQTGSCGHPRIARLSAVKIFPWSANQAKKKWHFGSACCVPHLGRPERRTSPDELTLISRSRRVDSRCGPTPRDRIRTRLQHHLSKSCPKLDQLGELCRNGKAKTGAQLVSILQLLLYCSRLPRCDGEKL